MRKLPLQAAWPDARADVSPKQFRCGFCDSFVASHHGWHTNDRELWLRICPHCRRPTYSEYRETYPGVAFGNPVQHLPEDVSVLYEESRICFSSSSFTAAVLVLRKLLMNIAVQKGAAESLSFIKYVEYLSNKGYVPPDGKSWVDHIRQKGNEATHEIRLMGKKDAEDLIVFTEMLLKFIYEFPSLMSQPETPQSS